VRNCAGAAPTQTVSVDHNTVTGFMKTGILANCDVNVSIDHNSIGASANQAALAANSIQLGFGATGSIDHNDLDGNQWCGASDDVATGILLYDSGPAQVSENKIGGNSDVGIYDGSGNTTVDHNKVTDTGADCNSHGYDIGIGNYGSDDGTGDATTNDVNHNTVSGFDTPYDGPVGSHNKVKPAH
jgi:parallel beta-helix repeat protein